MTVPMEHEMKFPVADLDALRRRLGELGGVLRSPMSHEQNWVLDDPTRRLALQGVLLRVRRSGSAAFLTFKGKARMAGGVKSRDEIECRVEDAGQVVAILARLGLAPVRRYEKRRETWGLGPVVVALDETPMGTFVEIEGPPEALAPAAAALGLEPERALAGTYLDLWEAYRRRHPEAPADMVFA